MKYIFLILISFLFANVIAQNLTRADAKKILFRTNRVIYASVASVKNTENFTGDLSQAHAYQKFAITFFRKGLFTKSVYHSLYARKKAENSIKLNKGNMPMEANLDSKENAFFLSSPSKESLIKEFYESHIAVIKEEQLIKSKLKINIE